MTSQEISKIYEKKMRELEELERQLTRAKYTKNIEALISAFGSITESDDAFNLINSQNLNIDDCKFFGNLLATNISIIFKNFEKEILDRQERRRLKKHSGSKQKTSSIEFSKDELMQSDIDSSDSLTRAY